MDDYNDLLLAFEVTCDVGLLARPQTRDDERERIVARLRQLGEDRVRELLEMYA